MIAFPLLALSLAAGCPPNQAGGNGQGLLFENTTDKTNANAAYVGSTACRQCHSDIAASHTLHGHANVLTPLRGGSPEFHSAATPAAVPDPPDGFGWNGVAYLIGGYVKKANFVDSNGFILTTGVAGTNTQWNLSFPPTGTPAAFVLYRPEAATPQPYAYSCFACHTTGPAPLDPAAPAFQDNRPGIHGTWAEAGIQCESCHGPGSGHFSTVNNQVIIRTDRIFVDTGGRQTCATCHARPFNNPDAPVIQASGGFIDHEQQHAELLASGGHAAFACTFCHDPHRSVAYDRANAIRNECRACHADQSMAGHAGKVFTRGDYTEPLSCQSCHMPFATRSAASAAASVVSPPGRMADTRTHVFRINTEPVDFATLFTADGASVRTDADGRAAVTVDFVCLRCHNRQGVFRLGDTPAEELSRAAEIASRVHELP